MGTTINKDMQTKREINNPARPEGLIYDYLRKGKTEEGSTARGGCAFKVYGRTVGLMKIIDKGSEENHGTRTRGRKNKGKGSAGLEGFKTEKKEKSKPSFTPFPRARSDERSVRWGREDALGWPPETHFHEETGPGFITKTSVLR